MRGRYWLLLALVGMPVCAHLADVYARAQALNAFTWQPAPSLDSIGSYAPDELADCPVLGGQDVAALAYALVTVESFATPSLQAWATGVAVRISAAMDLHMPDLTYGPGRVRLSTAARLTGRPLGKTGDAALALRLLDGCQAKTIVAAAVIDLLPPEHAAEDTRLDLATVRRVAKIYNGQVDARSPDAAVAHETYNRLVYALFQHYRFEALGRRP
jgi:hypothetical protein